MDGADEEARGVGWQRRVARGVGEEEEEEEEEERKYRQTESGVH